MGAADAVGIVGDELGDQLNYEDEQACAATWRPCDGCVHGCEDCDP